MNTIRVGSTGADVIAWQRILGITADGVFGKDTLAATRIWQKAHGLADDGIVGTKTWEKAGVTVTPIAPLGRVEKVPYNARIVDSYPFSIGGTYEQALALRNSPRPVDGIALYVGTPRKRCEDVLRAGLGFFFVTKAGEYNDGSLDEQESLRSIGYPSGASVGLDFEGLPAFEAGRKDPNALMGLLDAWGNPMNAAGWDAGLYIGAPQPLTGKELSARAWVKWFWLGIGRCKDRFDNDAYPDAGYVIRQDWHNEKNGIIWPGTDVLVDANSACFDHWGRRLNWVKSTS